MKKRLIILYFLMWILYFLCYPTEAFEASIDGIILWFYQILPTLLPYSILASAILHSNLIEEITLRTNRHTFLRISPAEWFVILCGFFFGFPIGCKLSSDLLREGLVPKKRAQILCAFTNNMSPLFVSSFVLNAQLGCPDLRLATYLILYGIPFIYGIIRLAFTPVEQTTSDIRKKPASRFQMNMQIIDAGIISSFETLIRLCGYIVMFSIMANIFVQFPLGNSWLQVLSTGILEITNGITVLALSPFSFQAKYILALTFLSIGGISGIAQTGSMIQGTGLSLPKYVRTRILLTVLVTAAAIIYQYLLSGTGF